MTLKDRLHDLYHGRNTRATRFRYAMLGFDAVSIIFFLGTATLTLAPWLLIADGLIGLFILLDMLARFWIAPDRWRHLRRFYVLVDIVVLASLAAAPFLGQGLMMLRLLRALRLVHSYHLMHDLRRDSRVFRRHEDTVISAVNLLVFIFAMTALVFVLRAQEPGLETYVDALYFTVATLTTTGFGDIAKARRGQRGDGEVKRVDIGLQPRLLRTQHEDQRRHREDEDQQVHRRDHRILVPPEHPRIAPQVVHQVIGMHQPERPQKPQHHQPLPQERRRRQRRQHHDIDQHVEPPQMPPPVRRDPEPGQHVEQDEQPDQPVGDQQPRRQRQRRGAEKEDDRHRIETQHRIAEPRRPRVAAVIEIVKTVLQGHPRPLTARYPWSQGNDPTR